MCCTRGEQLREPERQVRMVGQQTLGVVDDRDDRRLGRDDVGRGRHVEQQRQLAHARARVDDRRDRRAVLLDPQRAFQKNEQRAERLALSQQDFAGCQRPTRQAPGELEKGIHAPKCRARARR